jgi:hypothetical protein
MAPAAGTITTEDATAGTAIDQDAATSTVGGQRPNLGTHNAGIAHDAAPTHAISNAAANAKRPERVTHLSGLLLSIDDQTDSASSSVPSSALLLAFYAACYMLSSYTMHDLSALDMPHSTCK